MEKNMMNIKKDGFILNNKGFISLNLMLFLPALLMILVTAMLISKTMGKGILIYMDRCILHYQVVDVLENISTELRYADAVVIQKEFANRDLLIIKTKRRASAKESTFEQKTMNCIGYKKEKDTIYRYEMSDLGNGIFSVVAKQPMTGSYHWGGYNMEYQCRQLGDNIYEIEVSGINHFYEKYSLKTAIICQNILNNDE